MARYNTVTPVSSVSTGSTIASPQSGQLTTFTGSAGYTVVLANPVLFQGIPQSFFNNTGGSVTLSTPSGVIKGPGFTASTTQSIPNQSTYTLTSDGTDYVVTNNEGGPLLATTGAFSGDLTNLATTVNLFNSTVTTLNLGGASTSVSIGASTGTTTVNNDVNLGSGKVFKINTAQVLSSRGITMNGTSSGSTTIQAAASAAGTYTWPAAVTGTSNYALVSDTSGNLSWYNTASSITDDTSTSANYYPIISTVTSGSTSAFRISSSKFYFNPSTGLLTVTSLTESSSIALKENLTPITNALESISQLAAYIYDRKDGSSKDEAGLIAEDVYKVLPNLVSLDENGNPEGVKYSKLTAYLIEAVKELTNEIKNLKGN